MDETPNGRAGDNGDGGNGLKGKTNTSVLPTYMSKIGEKSNWKGNGYRLVGGGGNSSQNKTETRIIINLSKAL